MTVLTYTGSMALCDHLMEAESCADCHPRPRARDRPPPEYGPWFEAQHYSVCPECEAVIRPGESIRHDGYGGYLCVGCGNTGPGVFTVHVTGNML